MPKKKVMMSEPRWIRQKDEYSCGPIAVANVLKWAGVPTSWKRSKRSLQKLCRTNKDLGTNENDMEAALRKLGAGHITVQRRVRWKMAELIGHVESRGCVVVDFTVPFRYNMARPWNQRECHYAVCVDIMGEEGEEWFKFINLDREDTVTWINRRQFRWLFMSRRKGDRVWKIRKRS
jgi:hypothetical protein